MPTKNKSKTRAYNAAYYQANKEHAKAQSKKWRREHPQEKTRRWAEWKRANPEKVREGNRLWRRKHPEVARAWRKANSAKCYFYTVRNKYGLSEEAWRSMLIAQAGRCEICRVEMKEPHVDHDHSTGVVRSLLCRNCNATIGYVGEKVAVLREAIEYLTRHSAEVRSDGSRLA